MTTYYRQTMVLRYLLLALTFYLLFVVSQASAQEPVVVDALPVDIDTWPELFAFYLPKIVSGILAVVGTVLAFALRRLVTMLPPLVAAYIDTKRQRDFTSAIMTKVAQLIEAGRWPTATDVADVANELQRSLIEEIRQHVAQFSPQAAAWANVETSSARAATIIKAKAARAAIELTKAG